MTGPRDTKFKKGQSGSPNGRPKGSRSRWSRGYSDAILKAGDKLVSVNENGRTIQMTVHEATLKAQLKSAFNGSPMAQRHLIDTYRAEDAQRREDIAEECEHWEEIRNSLIGMRAEAERTGRPPAVLFPHPDDIVIDPRIGVRFVGLVDQDEQTKLEDTIRVRDLLLVQDQYDRRECKLDERSDPDSGAGGALLIAVALNDLLPARYRLSDVAMITRSDALNGLTKRELRTKLFREWRAQGRPVPRGKTFASLGETKEAMTTVYTAVAEAVKSMSPD